MLRKIDDIHRLVNAEITDRCVLTLTGYFDE